MAHEPRAVAAALASSEGKDTAAHGSTPMDWPSTYGSRPPVCRATWQISPGAAGPMARFTLMTVLSSGCVGLNFEAGVCGYSRNVSSGPGAAAAGLGGAAGAAAAFEE